MLEITFSESAAGALAVAAGKRNYSGEVSVAVIADTAENENPPTHEEIEKIIYISEEKERFNWENAVPLNTRRKDILCFNLALSIGDITENDIGKQRETTIQTLLSIYPYKVREAARNMIETSKQNLKELLYRVKNGEAIRIWTSDTPDDNCGLCWIMEQLSTIGFENLDVTCVKLPDFHIMPDNTTVAYSGWGEVPPHQWGHLALLGKKLPEDYMSGLALKWRRLKTDNSPLRAVVNHRLVGVPITFYDSFIFRELEDCEEEFFEANVIGKVLSKYSLGIGDGLVALRIEQFIKDGILKEVTKAKSEEPIYFKKLKKCSGGGCYER